LARKTAGDLTRGVSLQRPPTGFPRDNGQLTYTATVSNATASKLRQAQVEVRDNPAPSVPSGSQHLP
jgi:phospholipase C